MAPLTGCCRLKIAELAAVFGQLFGSAGKFRGFTLGLDSTSEASKLCVNIEDTFRIRSLPMCNNHGFTPKPEEVLSNMTLIKSL